MLNRYEEERSSRRLARCVVPYLSHGTFASLEIWLRGRDLNPRPLGYEPNELPDCSTPRHLREEPQCSIHICTTASRTVTVTARIETAHKRAEFARNRRKPASAGGHAACDAARHDRTWRTDSRDFERGREPWPLAPRPRRTLPTGPHHQRSTAARRRPPVDRHHRQRSTRSARLGIAAPPLRYFTQLHSLTRRPRAAASRPARPGTRAAARRAASPASPRAPRAHRRSASRRTDR